MSLSKEKLKSRVTYEVITPPEHMPIHGNLTYSGYDEKDREDEDVVIVPLDSGNDWELYCTEVKWEYGDYHRLYLNGRNNR